ncbi:ribosomal RNA processing protein 36 homolog isoform X1 [Triticum aestivum]|uniref:ribosomal RNA processing protein 36 homolog isoform X1 n=1 Tax=Triticum aestivum TaxID=4565 RepID=UPI000844BB12|nr:ribosomal RNA processing protein 36 homolog isoform X1 [Triticum aestivum]
MKGRSSHRGTAPTSAAASTSSKRDPEDEPVSDSEESVDEEVKAQALAFSLTAARIRGTLTGGAFDPQQDVSSSLGSESESENDQLAERERKLERVLADVPFGELQRARADGSLAARGVSAAAAAQKKARRESRKRPMEISTNVRPPRLREVIQVPKKVVRDPRFEPVYGAVDKEGFRKRYNFLFDHDLPAEKEKLQKSIKKLKDPNAIEEAKNQITWIDKQLRSNPQKNVESEILRGHIKKEREAAKAGKRPYYLKKSEIRERKLMDKYNELKETGKLDSFMEKRRKKNASKDHRFMPYRRDGGGA